MTAPRTGQPVMSDADREMWRSRAERLIEQALDQFRGFEDDALVTLSAADMAVRIAFLERSPDEMAAYPFPGEEAAGPECTCPPDLRARGGYASSCPRCGAS